MSVNKSGYEIRAQVLEMAKDFVENQFQSYWMNWSQKAPRDTNGNIISVTAPPMPEPPELNEVLETARRMYNFVETGEVINQIR